MLACVDVEYRASGAVAACVAFEGWSASVASEEQVARSSMPPAEYVPGEFYRRELPFLTMVLAQLSSDPDCVVIDGYVWLAPGVPGLGAHIHDARGNRGAVVGVAKRPFRGASHAIEVLRGSSKQPLFVTATGMDVEEAAFNVRQMHGPHRVPTLLKRVDRLCRDAVLARDDAP